MMNSAVVEIMEATGHTLPAAHSDGALMTALARDVQKLTGYENFGLPFCMTVEPEALGSDIDLGSLSSEPKIAKEAYASAADFRPAPIGAVSGSPRAQAILSSISELAKKYPDIPSIGGLTGPISSVASLVEPGMFLRQLRKDPASAHAVLSHVADQLADFASLMIESGAAVVCINDPTATGEILGPKMFREYAVRYINRVVEAVHRLGAPVIVHICGDIRTVTGPLSEISGDALSFDAMVDLAGFKRARPGVKVMGNVSTYLLEFGEPARIEGVAERLVHQGIDISAPACGLSVSTPLSNIRAFTGAVKNAGKAKTAQGAGPERTEPFGQAVAGGPK
jgi:[methyl-Co(III) methanol-specific corrinoid protein]:coenzyme M methyltransferase